MNRTNKFKGESGMENITTTLKQNAQTLWNDLVVGTDLAIDNITQGAKKVGKLALPLLLSAQLLTGCITAPRKEEPIDERKQLEERLKTVIEMNLADCFAGTCGRDHTNTGQTIGTEIHRRFMFGSKNSHVMHKARDYLNALNTEYDKIQAHLIVDSPRQCHLRGIKVNEVRIGTLGDESRILTAVVDPDWHELTTYDGVAGNGNLRIWLNEILENKQLK